MKCKKFYAQTLEAYKLTVYTHIKLYKPMPFMWTLARQKSYLTNNAPDCNWLSILSIIGKSTALNSHLSCIYQLRQLPEMFLRIFMLLPSQKYCQSFDENENIRNSIFFFLFLSFTQNAFLYVNWFIPTDNVKICQQIVYAHRILCNSDALCHIIIIVDVIVLRAQKKKIQHGTSK